MKVLFQELCKQKINWDHLLPTGIKEDWATGAMNSQGLST